MLVVLNLVANAPDCLNHLFAIRGFFDLIPQVADVDHHRLGRDHALLLPNPLEDIISGEDSVRVTGQQVQNPEFKGRQLNCVALDRFDLVGVLVDDQGPDVEHIRLVIGNLALTPPQQ